MNNCRSLVIFVVALMAGAVQAAVAQIENSSALPSRAGTSDQRAGMSPGDAPKNGTGTDASNTGAPIVRLDSGTLLVAELTKSLNARKLRPGDKITAKIIQAVVLKGKVVIPQGAKLAGNVTETKARSKEDPESRLGIIFVKVKTKDGAEFALDAVIQALAPAPPSSVDSEDPMLPPTLGQATASSAPQPIGSGRSTRSQGAPPPSPSRPSLSTSLSPNSPERATPRSKQRPQDNRILSAGSRGIFGLPGLTLRSTGTAQIPVIASIEKDVKLENGTQMVLRVADSAH